MKKTLFVAISILLVLFAFTACEGNPSGPDDGEALVTEAEAKTLATSYFNAIDFSKLIVEASAGSTGTGLTVTDPASNGFTVEFKDYKGNALTADTEAKISAIKSGSIKFTFSSAKSTVTANTYTAETVAPIVFAGAEDGVALVFELSGTAEISYETGMGGIAGLTPNTTVSLSKPAAKDVTISVGNVTVDFSDIEKDVTGGFGTEAEVPEEGTGEGGEGGEDPGTPSATVADAAQIFAALSRENIMKDVMAGLAGLDDPKDDVENVTLNSFSVLHNGKENSALEGTFKTIFSELAKNPNNLQSAIAHLAAYRDLYNIDIVISASFDEYTNGLKSGMGVYSITEGTVTATLTLGRFDISKGTMYGTYTVSTDENAPIKVATSDGVYTISISNLASGFSMGKSGNDLQVTSEKDDTPETSISLSNGTPTTLSWPDLAAEIKKLDTEGAETNFATDTAEQLDAEYFYQHFGTKRFLNALYDAFTHEGTSSEYGLSITNYNDGSIAFNTTAGEEQQGSEKSLTINLNFNNYSYYYKEGTQTVSESGSITFTGTVTDNTFTATSFEANFSELNLTDSSTTNKRPAATTTLTDASGSIGSAGTEFILTEGNVTGIKNYTEDTNPTGENEIHYVDTSHAFTLSSGINNVEIKLD